MQQKLNMQLERKKTEILVTTKPENHYFNLNFYLKNDNWQNFAWENNPAILQGASIFFINENSPKRQITNKNSKVKLFLEGFDSQKRGGK